MPRGGKRLGAGRKPGQKTSEYKKKPPHLKRQILNSFRLPKWMIDRIQAEEYPGGGGRLIEDAVLKKMGWTPPDPDEIE